MKTLVELHLPGRHDQKTHGRRKPPGNFTELADRLSGITSSLVPAGTAVLINGVDVKSNLRQTLGTPACYHGSTGRISFDQKAADLITQACEKASKATEPYQPAGDEDMAAHMILHEAIHGAGQDPRTLPPAAMMKDQAKLVGNKAFEEGLTEREAGRLMPAFRAKLGWHQDGPITGPAGYYDQCDAAEYLTRVYAKATKQTPTAAERELKYAAGRWDRVDRVVSAIAAKEGKASDADYVKALDTATIGTLLFGPTPGMQRAFGELTSLAKNATTDAEFTHERQELHVSTENNSTLIPYAEWIQNHLAGQHDQQRHGSWAGQAVPPGAVPAVASPANKGQKRSYEYWGKIKDAATLASVINAGADTEFSEAGAANHYRKHGALFGCAREADYIAQAKANARRAETVYVWTDALDGGPRVGYVGGAGHEWRITVVDLREGRMRTMFGPDPAKPMPLRARLDDYAAKHGWIPVTIKSTR